MFLIVFFLIVVQHVQSVESLKKKKKEAPNFYAVSPINGSSQKLIVKATTLKISFNLLNFIDDQRVFTSMKHNASSSPPLHPNLFFFNKLQRSEITACARARLFGVIDLRRKREQREIPFEMSSLG